MKYCFKQKKGLKGKATESFEDCSVVKILLPSYCRSRTPGYCKIETEEKHYLEKHYAFEHGSIVSQLDEGAWLRLRLGQDCVEMHLGTVSGDELIGQLNDGAILLQLPESFSSLFSFAN